MKSLFIHAKNFGTQFHSFANRPKNIVHEKVEGKIEQRCQDCITILVTVENGDNSETVNKIVNEIIKIGKELGRNRVVIVPFAHLSNNIAEPKIGLEIIRNIESKLKENHEVISNHFGSNKSLSLETYGHAGNIRFREF